jgi:hypothetical protein
METFVLGGAILLHDSALCFEAYEGGVVGLRNTLEWKDSYAAERDRNFNLPDDQVTKNADFAALRILHARQAEMLASRAWRDPTTSNEIFLIDDYEIRKRYGALIGAIAAAMKFSLSMSPCPRAAPPIAG